jgi:hypothetical protein
MRILDIYKREEGKNKRGEGKTYILSKQLGYGSLVQANMRMKIENIFDNVYQI